ncbi:alcohol dehydrogenase [Bifidobacterium sp. CP2]|uniref:alcohol dehydrogenase n=1 Tax=Bifidobacterium TaxID=1678 RepID=UPI001BDD1075|nr:MULTISPECIES: alcohol dehydrogenase [Bifidobacterium]MBT1181153.1 alcohol dehydrogenase [Bifidobacterium sp. CP2]MBW3079825.1 alcohol dehydrogenase [Bifidobacterium saguinibicoloris]
MTTQHAPSPRRDPSAPWSHRFGPVGRTLVTLAAGAGAAFFGTLAHRMGASADIPYGLALAFLIIGLSTFCARARQGVTGLALHLIVSSITAWGLAVGGAGDDALVVAGFSTPMPFFSQHAGYIWLYGVIVVQVVMLALPSRWFVIPPRKAE